MATLRTTGINIYALQAFGASGTPSDGSTQYFGSRPSSAPGSVNNQKIYIPRGGVVKAVYLFFANTANTSGATESSTANFWLNNTSRTQISNAVTNGAAQTAFSNTALTIPVVAGDFFEIEMVWASWANATNPTITPTAVVYIEG